MAYITGDTPSHGDVRAGGRGVVVKSDGRAPCQRATNFCPSFGWGRPPAAW
jgi:hypothetical protein